MNKAKNHWENIYQTRKFEEVSWYEEVPEPSLDFIDSLELAPEVNIIDIGGGDSHLVDHLLKRNFQHITVLDISELSLQRARKRLGGKTEKVSWIASDVTEFQPEEKYDLWHDRAAFHFLTDEENVHKYLQLIDEAIPSGGYLILATFSEKGPDECSGRNVKQYSTTEMKELLQDNFEALEVKNVDHETPGEAIQNFTYGLFKKK